MNLIPELLLLLLLLPTGGQGEHVLRFLTFCQANVSGQYDIEFNGDQLLYVDEENFHVVLRLPEFAEQWTPDRSLPEDMYVSLGTCWYNIPRASIGYENPPEAIANPTSTIYSKEELESEVPNTLICFINNFHPPKVSVTWTRNGELVDPYDVSQTQYYSNSDFTFYTFSYLSFIPQEGDIYACSVDHLGLQEPLTRFWDVELHTDRQIVESAVCVCGVIVGLIGVGVGVWLIMKANKSSQMLRGSAI